MINSAKQSSFGAKIKIDGLLRRCAPRNDKERLMDDEKRRDDGMTQRRKVLGDAWVDKSIANRNSFNTDFQDLITRYAWGEIWTRPHFDQRTRRVLVIGTMVALGQWDEFRLHVRAALTEGGFTSDDIKEILLQQAIYCGVPAANHAVKEASAIVGGARAAERIDRVHPRRDRSAAGPEVRPAARWRCRAAATAPLH